MKKRIAIYCIYDKKGIVDNYIVFCINALKRINSYVVVVSNHGLSIEMRQKLSCADCVFEREDIGFDAGGIADAFNKFIGWNMIETFDEAIILNDSIFGPLFDLQEMFDEMDKRDKLDFWGITKRAESDFDGGDVVYPEHIQLYFYVIRNRMLRSESFKQYWNCILDKIVDFRSAIINYEFKFTKYFEMLDYQWGVYIEDEEFQTPYLKRNLSPYHYDMYRLIVKWRCPFIKRKLFTGDFIFLENSDRSNVRTAFDWIQLHTLYDVNMIWSHILRIYYLQDLIAGLQMYELLPVKQKKDKLNVINKKENKIYYWDEDGNYVGSQYDPDGYALIIHFQKEDNVSYTLLEAKQRLVECNLFPNEQSIEKIIELFREEERLGVIVPPPYTYGKITTMLTNQWSDKREAQVLYERMSLTVPFDPVYAPVYAVDGLWCRAKFLQEGIDAFFHEDKYRVIMQMMPLIAQEKGFYTKILMNIIYARIYMENMNRIVSNILMNVRTLNLSLKEAVDEMNSDSLNYFCEKNSIIYIYGAGERAVRTYRFIKDKCNVKGFIVTNCEGNPTMLEGLQVHAIDLLKTEIDKMGIVVTVGIRSREQIQNVLLTKGIKNIYWI